MISAIVCTRDRARRLERTLSAFRPVAARMTRDWELVVVDNGSRDETAELLAEWTSNAELPLITVRQLEPGLSNARNAGVRAAAFDVIAFTDDDCLPDADWTSRIADHFASDAGLDVLGGRVELASALDAPVGVRALDDDVAIDSLAAIQERIIGCNLSIRRGVLARIGLFDRHLGAGTSFASAEELDLVYRALRAGHRIAYRADVRVRHDHGRRDAADVTRLNRGYRLGRAAFYGKHLLADGTVRRHAYWEARSLWRERRLGALGAAGLFFSGLMRGILLRSRPERI